jgi:Fe-S oxidoreductase
MTETYRQAGTDLDVEIMHTVQFIEALLRQGKLSLRKKQASVTFHDPCILSYDLAMSTIPREIITALGFSLKEPVYSGEHTHCCGGAYGAKIGDHRLKDAVTSMRLNEIKETGADIYVTACDVQIRVVGNQHEIHNRTGCGEDYCQTIERWRAKYRAR